MILVVAATKCLEFAASSSSGGPVYSLMSTVSTLTCFMRHCDQLASPPPSSSHVQYAPGRQRMTRALAQRMWGSLTKNVQWVHAIVSQCGSGMKHSWPGQNTGAMNGQRKCIALVLYRLSYLNRRVIGRDARWRHKCSVGISLPGGIWFVALHWLPDSAWKENWAEFIELRGGIPSDKAELSSVIGVKPWS